MPNKSDISLPKLTPAGEQAWSEFLRHVEWPDGFALIFLFSSISAVINIFRERLTRVFGTAVSTVQIIAPSDAGQLVEAVLTAIRNSEQRFESLRSPLWIEACQGHEAEWIDARCAMLARINEHRDMMRSRLHRPVIIVLPGGFRQRLREIAPDLWSVRNHSIDLDEIRSLHTDDGEVASAGPDREAPPQLGNAEALLAEWHRIVGRATTTNRDVFVAGERAIHAALSLARVEQAYAIAADLLKMARQAAAAGASQTAMRDLSVSFENVGDTAGRLGNLGEAGAAYAESLKISRGLVERYGATPESLRDLSVSLNNVGDTSGRMGNLGEAGAAYAESLKISRDIVERYGATPESLRDLSVSLNNVGDMSGRMGNFGEAGAAYVESLKIRRDLVERYSATPESLRDLSVSLEKMGDTAGRMGNLGEAGAAYAESLKISRDIVERYGATPESLRDLSVSLNKVGNTSGRMGNLVEAGAAYAESLKISRDIVERYGATPESLRDLSVSLNKVGDTAGRMGNFVDAEAACRENIMVLRRLSHAFPDIQEYRDMLRQAETNMQKLQKGKTISSISGETLMDVPSLDA